MPASRSFFLTVPEPDPTVSDVDSQLSARAVAQEAARPVLGRDALGQFLDGDRLRDGLPLLRRPPAARLGRGNMESRLLGPNPLGAMHVGDEGLVRVLQSPQKARLLAITGVDAHPSEPHPARARRTMSSACSLFDVSWRAASGTPASSQRAGFLIQRSGRYSRMSTGACRSPSVSTANTAT